MGWMVRECWGKGMADGGTVENAAGYCKRENLALLPSVDFLGFQ